MTAAIAGVLLIPTDPSLLNEGVGGSCPPVASRSTDHPVWVEGHWKTTRALMLAWKGEPLSEGCWRLDRPAAGMAWVIQLLRTGADLGYAWRGVGVLVLVDNDGREVTTAGSLK